MRTRPWAVGTAAALASVALPALTPIAANAAVTNYSSKTCYDYVAKNWAGLTKGTIVVCTQYGFRRQDDGDGVFAERVYVDINRGCEFLEPGVTYNMTNQYAWLTRYDNGAFIVGESLADRDGCHWQDVVSMRGQDVGRSVGGWQGTLMVDNGPDIASKTHFHTLEF